MSQSVTNQYVLFSVHAKTNDSLFQRDYLAAIAALGLYELEKSGCIGLDGDNVIQVLTELPSDMAYLGALYDAIAESKSKSMESVLAEVFFNKASRYSEQIIGNLEEAQKISESVHKGIFGIEQKRMEAAEEEVEESRRYVLALCDSEPKDADRIALAQVLAKTGLLYRCFSKKEAGVILDALKTAQSSSGEDICSKTLRIIDKAYALSLAFLSTIIFS